MSSCTSTLAMSQYNRSADTLLFLNSTMMIRGNCTSLLVGAMPFKNQSIFTVCVNLNRPSEIIKVLKTTSSVVDAENCRSSVRLQRGIKKITLSPDHRSLTHANALQVVVLPWVRNHHA
eukprot:TRINITY_DN7050_c0_g1_i1.p2 TRINITY_DN7050_c0_g1~~TRINITY_DN7050_c0_g1_i1.p2  ORF type:complete len:119 (-),score=3.26 TRINITY_DN7050_c0_g1_i1:663-1019(-)